MNDDILTALAATTDPAEKAALVAEFALADLPPAVATAARRAVILHWFNTEVLAALLPAESELPAADVYNLLAGLPFIEHLPHGLAYHDLTRTGLLTRYMANQSDALRAGATLAASVYAAAEDKMVVLEGLYCHILAGNQTEATGLLETLIYWAGAREDWAALLNVFEIRDEAERYTFAETLPRIALHYFATGLAHQSLKQYDKALADYTRAIELNPEDAAAYNNRGSTYDDLKQYDKALADYTRAIELNPEDAAAYNNRGITFKNLKQYDEALADYTRAIELNPEYAAFYNRGITYDDLKQYDKALADYTRAIELNPEYAAAYNNRGITFKNLKQYDKALADYTRAIELNPEYADAFYNTACAYAFQNNVEAALSPLRRALELDPEKILASIPTDSDFDLIRNHPDFIALLDEFSSQQQTS